eukprot:s3212_g5.t2
MDALKNLWITGHPQSFLAPWRLFRFLRLPDMGSQRLKGRSLPSLRLPCVDMPTIWKFLVLARAVTGAVDQSGCESDRGEDDTCALSLAMRRFGGDTDQVGTIPISEGLATCKGEHHCGDCCIFPFILDGVRYTTCTSYGHPGKQWRATEVDQDRMVIRGTQCSEECPQDRRTAIEACKAVSMKPGRCGAKNASDTEACLVNACPARCKNQSTFPYPGASPSYSALTGFPAMNDAILKKQLHAVDTLKSFAPGFTRTPEDFDLLHSTLSYICCKTEAEVEAYQKALSSFKFSWRDVGAINWKEVGCSLDDLTDPSIIYLEAFVPKETNQKLMSFAHRLEEHMASLGFADSNPRAIPFHFVISMLPLQLPGGPVLNAGDAMKDHRDPAFGLNVVYGTTALTERMRLGGQAI